MKPETPGVTRKLYLAWFAVLPLLLSACAHRSYDDRLVFEAQSPEFSDAANEYREIWKADGDRIVRSLERATGLQVETGPIHVIVYEGVSRSGYRDIPMNMRASYPLDTKRGTLVHELSHRLIGDLVPKRFEDHPIIFLFLYDVWVELWGESFADAQVAVESRRRGIYDYEAAWKTALALGPEGRAARWREFVRDLEQ